MDNKFGRHQVLPVWSVDSGVSISTADDEAIQNPMTKHDKAIVFGGDSESFNSPRERSGAPISLEAPRKMPDPSMNPPGRFGPDGGLPSMLTFNDSEGWPTNSHCDVPPELQHSMPRGVDTDIDHIRPPVSEHVEAIQCAVPNLDQEQLHSLKDALGETLEKINSSLEFTTGELKTGGSGMNEKWRCWLCNVVTTARSSFKRHLNSRHYPRSKYRCPEEGCGLIAHRRDKISTHVVISHHRAASRLEIDACTEEYPCPPFCSLCARKTDSWDAFYQCLLSHSFVKRTDREGNSAMDSSSNPAALILPRTDVRRLAEPRKRGRRAPQRSRPMLFRDIQLEKKDQNSTKDLPEFNSAEGPLLRQPDAVKTQGHSQNDGTVAQRVKKRRHFQEDGEDHHETDQLPGPTRPTEGLDDSEETRAKRSRLYSPSRASIGPSQTSYQENGRHIVLPGSSPCSEESIILHSEDRSTTDSMDTTVTSPEEDEEDIDAGVTDPGNMEHILCPATYYHKLDMLELKTAELCGIRQGPTIHDGSLSECLRVFQGIRDALHNLEVEGFCGSVMSIFAEDQSRPDVANTVHISLGDIDRLVDLCVETRTRRFTPELLVDFCSEIVRNLVGDSFLQQHSEPALDWLLYCRLLSTVLSIGLVSFSGSHVCRFDHNLWGQEMNELPVGCGYSFCLRQLACLKDFIGGPAWVLCRSRPQSGRKRLKVSLMVQDLQELWGPVWLVGGTPDAGPIVRTERGYIVPLPLHPTRDVPSDEIECHWTKENPGHTNQQQPTLLSSTSRILIGTDSAATTLTHNLDCQSDIGRIQAHIYRQLPITGTCDERLAGGDYEVQLTGGQFINMGLAKRFKRYPMRTRKMSLIEECKSRNVRLIPLLKLCIGLEVSACTSNAQRVTLWDALCLSQKRPCQAGQVAHCNHQVADPDCIRSCWTRCSPTDDIDADVNIPRESSKLNTAEIRRLIIDSIVALEHTGIDHEGNLQACWPFTDVRRTRCIKRSTANESNNWLGAIKDTREVATFAVVSQRCLEFRQQVYSRPCSTTCNIYSGTIKNVLSTRILLNPYIELSCMETDPDCLSLGNETLSPGDTFVLGEAVLTVKRIVSGRQMVVIATSVRNTVQSKMARAFIKGRKVPRFCEDADPELAPGLSVVALVIY